MNITQIIQILNNKVTVLMNAKIQAFTIGDLDQYNQLENAINETKNTISQLTLLEQMTQAAAVANVTPAEVITSGIEAIQGTAETVQGPSASAVINGYDISAYATDTEYEQKIKTIISIMPIFTTVGDVDKYIKGITTDSPVTGKMIASTAEKFNVDIPLLIAIIQNDSCFGTLGVGARTNNPGNIGNTGSATYAFNSWEEGVMGVGEWLNNHRVAGVPIAPTEAAILAPEAITPPEIETPSDEDLPVIDPVQNPPEVTTPPEVETPIDETLPVIDPVIDTGTTTPPVIDMGTTSPPTIDTGTSTPPIIDTGTTTPPIIDTGTTTPPVIDPMLDRGTSTPPIIDTSTSTSPVIDTSTLPTATTTPFTIEQSTSTTTDSSGTVSLSKRIRRLRV